MITNNDVQEAVIDWLKANSTITALLSDTDEIREQYWQGEKFTYPNIRVMCEITPSSGGCGPDECFMVISVFSEQKSSKQAQNISGTISTELHDKEFIQNGIRFSAIRVMKTPRATVEDGIWLSQSQVQAKVK